MRKYMVVATEAELRIPWALARAAVCQDFETIVTGVGGTNVIRALKDIPRDSMIMNVGYCGSRDFPVGWEVVVRRCRLYHPNVDFQEQTFEINENGRVLCLTAGDFVVNPKKLPEQSVVDMELAYIAAFGFREVIAVKQVSDNFDLEQYEHTSRMSSLIPSVDGSPAAGSGPALTTGAGRGEH